MNPGNYFLDAMQRNSKFRKYQKEHVNLADYMDWFLPDVYPSQFKDGPMSSKNVKDIELLADVVLSSGLKTNQIYWSNEFCKRKLTQLEYAEAVSTSYYDGLNSYKQGLVPIGVTLAIDEPISLVAKVFTDCRFDSDPAMTLKERYCFSICSYPKFEVKVMFSTAIMSESSKIKGCREEYYHRTFVRKYQNQFLSPEAQYTQHVNVCEFSHEMDDIGPDIRKFLLLGTTKAMGNAISRSYLEYLLDLAGVSNGVQDFAHRATTLCLISDISKDWRLRDLRNSNSLDSDYMKLLIKESNNL